MTPWYSGTGGGGCNMAVNIPVMVLLWVEVFIAIVLAVRWPGVVAAQHVRGEIANDEFVHRLM